MKKFLIFLILPIIISCSVNKIEIQETNYKFPLSDYIHNGYTGHSGKYFLSDKEKIYGADINKNDDGIYLLERNLTDKTATMYLCSAPIQRTKLGGYLFHCNAPYINASDLFIKLDMVYADDSEQKEKMIFVSVGDNKDCIEKYGSPIDFEKKCNPKTSNKITYLKLYNLYF